jgi:hypothetical protein
VGGFERLGIRTLESFLTYGFSQFCEGGLRGDVGVSEGTREYLEGFIWKSVSLVRENQ